MKRKWEIWVEGPTMEGNVNKCVALFEDTPQRAELFLQYAEDSYGPDCKCTLRSAGESFELRRSKPSCINSKRHLMTVQQ